MRRIWILPLAIVIVLTPTWVNTFFQPVFPVWAQVSNPGVIGVAVAPSGSCVNGLPLQMVVSTGALYSCQSGTWAEVGGSGAVSSVFGRTGAVAAQSGDYSSFYLPLTGGALTGALQFSATGTNQINFLNSHTSTTDGITWANFGYPIGIYGGPGNGIAFKLNNFGSSSYVQFAPASLTVKNSSMYIGWGGNMPGNPTPGSGSFYNPSSGVIDCNASSSDTHDCTFNVATLGYSLQNPTTIYSAAGTALPTCAVGIKGEQAVVSDATTPTYMGTYTSGGAVTAAVICSYDGTTYSWLTH